MVSFSHNVHNYRYFQKIFGMYLQKGLIYLYFWSYNLSPNGQIISLIGAQAHL